MDMNASMKASRSLSSLDGQTVSSTLSKRLEKYGLDIAAPLQLSLYNSDVAARNAQKDDASQVTVQPLCAPGMSRPDVDGCNLTVLIGNSRRIWSPFLASLRKGGSHTSSNDDVVIDIEKESRPLDTYVMRCVEKALEETKASCDVINDAGNDKSSSSTHTPLKWRCYWSHVVEDGETVAIQRMGEIADVAELCPTTHLSLHPQYGPWMAWRAAVVFNVQFQVQCTEHDLGNVERCHYSRGLATDVKQQMETAIANASDWTRWLAVREALAPDHSYRYSEMQIKYHYTKDKTILLRAIESRC